MSESQHWLEDHAFDTQSQRIVEMINVELPNRATRALTLTSAVQGEGVSTVTWALARQLARNPGCRVLVVDANLYAPISATLLGEVPDHGLVSLLLDRVNAEDVVQPANGPWNVKVLPAGRFDASLFGSVTEAQVEKALSGLRERFNYVLVDAAPVTVSPFSLLLTKHSDGVLLVTEAGGTPRDLVAGTVAQIRRAGAKLLGVVLNRNV